MSAPAEPTAMIVEVVDRWHRFMRDELPDALDDLLDADAVMYSPVVFTPQRGKAIVAKQIVERVGQFVAHEPVPTVDHVNDRSSGLSWSAHPLAASALVVGCPARRVMPSIVRCMLDCTAARRRLTMRACLSGLDSIAADVPDHPGPIT